MSVFRRDEALTDRIPRRYRIKLTTTDGQVFYWHKRGKLHVVDEEVADVFVAHFNPELFQVHPDGTLGPPAPPKTFRVKKVEKEPV